MMLRRSQKEAARRNQDRQTAAKAIGENFRSQFRSAHSHEAVVAMPVATKQEDPANRDLTRQAIHFATKQLREAGVHGVSISSGVVKVTGGIQGFRRASIQAASVRLSATTPYSDGKKVASRSFDLNVSYAGGKFSLDSAERLGQVFPINRDSIRRIISIEDEKPNFNLPKKERNLTREEIQKEKERLQREWAEKKKREAIEDPFGTPSSENEEPSRTDPANYVDPDENMDANEDVKRHGGMEDDAERDGKNSCSAKNECGGKRKKGQFIGFGDGADEDVPQKFCFSVPTRDGRTYSVWKVANSEAEARKKLADEVGQNYAERSKVTSTSAVKKGQATGHNPFQEGAKPRRLDEPTPHPEGAKRYPQSDSDITDLIADLFSEAKTGEEIFTAVKAEYPGIEDGELRDLIDKEVNLILGHCDSD